MDISEVGHCAELELKSSACLGSASASSSSVSSGAARNGRWSELLIMVLLDNDGFLTGLTKLFNQTRNSGSVFLTMKKYNGRTKPKPKPKSKKAKAAAAPHPHHHHHHHEGEEHLCLLRATTGKKTISTVVSGREVTKFQMAYANLIKANMDALKKRDKKTAKAAAKKSKPTQ